MRPICVRSQTQLLGAQFQSQQVAASRMQMIGRTFEQFDMAAPRRNYA